MNGAVPICRFNVIGIDHGRSLANKQMNTLGNQYD